MSLDSEIHWKDTKFSGKMTGRSEIFYDVVISWYVSTGVIGWWYRVNRLFRKFEVNGCAYGVMVVYVLSQQMQFVELVRKTLVLAWSPAKWIGSRYLSNVWVAVLYMWHNLFLINWKNWNNLKRKHTQKKIIITRKFLKQYRNL